MRYRDYGSDELAFLSEPTVGRFPAGETFPAGKGFYVFGIVLTSKNEPNNFYLHSNGRWGESTFNGEEHAGYFATKEKADALLAQQHIRRHPMFVKDLTKAQAVTNYKAGLYRP